MDGEELDVKGAFSTLQSGRKKDTMGEKARPFPALGKGRILRQGVCNSPVSATAETDEGRNGREQSEYTHLGSPQSAALPRYFLSWARITCWVSGWKNSRVPWPPLWTMNRSLCFSSPARTRLI